MKRFNISTILVLFLAGFSYSGFSYSACGISQSGTLTNVGEMSTGATSKIMYFIDPVKGYLYSSCTSYYSYGQLLWNCGSGNDFCSISEYDALINSNKYKAPDGSYPSFCPSGTTADPNRVCQPDSLPPSLPLCSNLVCADQPQQCLTPDGQETTLAVCPLPDPGTGGGTTDPGTGGGSTLPNCSDILCGSTDQQCLNPDGQTVTKAACGSAGSDANPLPFCSSLICSDLPQACSDPWGNVSQIAACPLPGGGGTGGTGGGTGTTDPVVCQWPHEHFGNSHYDANRLNWQSNFPMSPVYERPFWKKCIDL